MLLWSSKVTYMLTAFSRWPWGYTRTRQIFEQDLAVRPGPQTCVHCELMAVLSSPRSTSSPPLSGGGVDLLKTWGGGPGCIMAVAITLCALYCCLTVPCEMTSGPTVLETNPMLLENGFPFFKALASKSSAFPQRMWFVVNWTIFLQPIRLSFRWVCRWIFTWRDGRLVNSYVENREQLHDLIWFYRLNISMINQLPE